MNRRISKDVSDNVIAGAVMASSVLMSGAARIIEAHASDTKKVTVNKGSYEIPVEIGAFWFLVDTATHVDSATDIDTGAVAAETAYYLYAVTDESTISFKTSLSAANPTGYDTAHSKLLGGFTTDGSKDITASTIWDVKLKVTTGGYGYSVDNLNISSATASKLAGTNAAKDIVSVTITDGEGIDTTAGAGTLTIACEDASTSNKGVTVYSGSTKALAGTDTASAMTPADVAAKVAVDVNLRAMSQGVAMTAAESGSRGIAVADNDNLNMGTGNFSPYFCGIIPDVTPATNIILAQKHDGTNGWILTLLTTGYLRTTINAATYDSTATLASVGVTDGASMKILSGITRETASVAGSVQHYVNGYALGTSVAITAGAPTTVTNAVSLYVLGTSAVRTAGVANTVVLFNRALTAAEVLDLYRNGVNEADKWGSQTELVVNGTMEADSDWDNYISPTTNERSSEQAHSGTYSRKVVADATANGIQTTATMSFIAGTTYKYSVWIYNAEATTQNVTVGQAVANIGLTNNDQVNLAVGAWTEITATFRCILTAGAKLFIRSQAAQTFYVDDVSIKAIGATLALEPANAQPVPGMWLDSSTNKLHAIYPAAGATITKPKDTFVVKWVNTWAGTHEAQYLGGIDQAMLPAKCCITSILGVVAGSTIEDIILGDGSDTDHWVAITSGLAAGTVNFTVANAISDGTNYKLVVDPDANFTGSITWTIRGYIYQ